jgi:hypothetical protein
MVAEERRRFPRLDDNSLAVKLDGFDSITHTLNVSPSGVYCKVDKELPLMSRVKLMLMVPDAAKDTGSVKNLEVSGIVVREHPVIVDGIIKHYDIAIFFDDLSARDKDIISAYISKKKGAQ